MARAECRPAAVPIGDPVLVQSLRERLSASGITTAPAAGCPAVRVELEQRGDQLHLRVVDAYQRLGERDVGDVATAAAVIESWTLQEIEPGAVPAEPAIDAPAAPAPVLAPAAASSRLAIGAASRTAVGDDGSTWLGGGLDACVRVGWACLGATGSVAADTSTVADLHTGSHRSVAVAALAAADAPLRIGRFVARPGITAGYGWERLQQQHVDAHGQPLSIAASSYALRVGTHASLAYPLARSLAVFGELFGDVAAARTTPDGPRARAGLALGVRLEAP